MPPIPASWRPGRKAGAGGSCCRPGPHPRRLPSRMSAWVAHVRHLGRHLLVPRRRRSGSSGRGRRDLGAWQITGLGEGGHDRLGLRSKFRGYASSSLSGLRLEHESYSSAKSASAPPKACIGIAAHGPSGSSMSAVDCPRATVSWRVRHARTRGSRGFIRGDGGSASSRSRSRTVVRVWLTISGPPVIRRFQPR